MKAVRIHQFGGPEVLTYEDVPDPQPRKDQVLVRVKACSLNHLDLCVRKGLPGVKLPHILGSDIAGEVAEIRHEHRAFHDVGKRQALVVQNRLHVLQHAFGLRLDIAGDEVAGGRLNGNLPGAEQQVAGADAMVVGADGGG